MTESIARSLTVLLIEDNPGDRRLAEIALREAGGDANTRCEVVSAKSLTQGMSQLTGGGLAPDAVLLDLGLPDSTGLDGLRTLRGVVPSVPIIVLTGLADLTLAAEALNVGASDYIEKSDIQPRTLLRAIRYAIERKKAEAELVRLARTNSLTGLLNRRAFFEQLESALVQARRSEIACAVIMFDIDRFKEINDVFGHKTGDELLVAVADTLRHQLRETDSIGRIGGDEFAVLATNLRSANDAMEIAEKISRSISAIVDLDDVRVDVSISIGISVFPIDNSSADVLVTHADMAMYKSKASKKGSINFFDARMDAAVKARHALKSSMPGDITSGKFYLVFQPIVDANTRKIVGAEGLARWRDLNNKVIAPDEFIPIAEESGEIAHLGSWLLEEACGLICKWAGQHKAVVPVALNISPVQCRDPAFGARLISAIDKSGIDPRLINIEITEFDHLQEPGDHPEEPRDGPPVRGRHLDRRFRHRLFVAVAAQGPAAERPQDRPQFRAWHRQGRRIADDCPRGGRTCQQARFQDGCRRGRDRGAGRHPARHRRQQPAGILLLQAGRQRPVRRLAVQERGLPRRLIGRRLRNDSRSGRGTASAGRGTSAPSSGPSGSSRYRRR